MVRAVLFDMDGVLVDSLRTHFHAFNATLLEFGGEKVSLEAYQQRFWGMYVERAFKIIFGHVSIDKVKEMTDQYALQVKKHVEHTVVYPDAKMVLTELKKRECKLGLITNSPKETAEIILKHVGLLHFFDIVICGDQIMKPKPAPDGILEACRHLGIRPRETIYTGDNVQDIVAGKAAGCFTVGITTTSSREELGNADSITESLRKLLDLTT